MNTTKDTLDHDSHDGRVEHPTTHTVSLLDRPVASIDARRPTLEPPSRRHWLGWVLVVAALVAAAALAVSLLAGNDGSPSPVGDAKDHVGYGQATPVVAAPLGDAKDHAGYGQVTPVVAGSVGDAKDHAGYGQVTPVVAGSVGDAKDHAGYGQVTPVVAGSVGDAKDHAGYGSSTAD